VSFLESTSILDDMSRRDTTMNSIARDILTGELIDPFGGAGDIASRVIRATSEHFSDDPVRALRAARQSAQFGYSIDERTVRLMRDCRDELASEPSERIANELARALGTPRPSVFFRTLMEARLLDVTYPHIFALSGAESAHREDAFERTMSILDRVSSDTDRIEARFAALAHDIGEDREHAGEDPRRRDRIKSGVSALRGWNAVMRLPSRWLACAEFVITERARVSEISSPGEIVDFLERLRRNPIGPDGLSAVMRAGVRETPGFLINRDKCYDAMDAISGNVLPADLTGPARGYWLRARRAEAIMRITEGMA
jgi:tRNA nucleotidyltransferase (CCA-adding enzyme)